MGEPFRATARTWNDVQTLLVESLRPYYLTAAGREFVAGWVGASRLDTALPDDE